MLPDKIRIAVVSNTSWSLYNFRLNLMKTLEKEGYDIIGIAPEDEYTKKIPFPVYSVQMNRRGTNPFQEISLMKQFKKILKSQKIDLMLNFTAKPNIWGTIAAKQAGCLAVNNIAGLGNTFTQKGLLTSIMKSLYRFSQKKASHIFFQNDDDLELFQKAGILKNTAFDLLPGSGVDTQRFHPDLKQNKRNKLHILMMARLLKHKGVFIYADAVEKLQKDFPGICDFQLLGPLDPGNPSGISKRELEDLQEKGIHYLGETSDTVPFLADADCFVLPSYYREGTPKSVLEALSLGLPVITTEMPGCRDTVRKEENGWLITPESSSSLEKALREFIGLSEKERDIMGKASRKLALERFDEKLVLDAYCKCLSALNPMPQISET